MRLATRSWGEEGRPLAVLVHGVSASSRTWWRVGPWFAQNGWHAVAVDLRGHGASPRMSGDEGLGDLVEDLHETLSGMLAPGETCNVLLGHSDRRRINALGKLVPLPPGNGASRGTFLVDGWFAGTWRIDDGELTLAPFHELAAADAEALRAEADALLEFVGG